MSVGTMLSLVFAVSACGFYFDDDDDPCEDVDFGGGASDPVPQPPPIGQINPDTGQCEFFGGGGPNPPFPCNSECGPCVGGGNQGGDREPGLTEPQPSWGFCESFCTGLAETTCLGTAGCRAAYTDGGSGPDVFAACWMIDQTGPVSGDCTGLDAYSCSLHDDCVAIHGNACGTDPNGDEADPLPPDTCLGVFTQCAAEPSTTGPGNCYDEVVCEIEPPVCPANTVPGVANGCYTGFCIPLDQCEGAPACAAVADEVTCIGRADCEGLYEGNNCTCDASGCDCVDWTFERCETAD